MLLELCPVVEIKLEIRKFYNVDLHTKGYYHIRSKLKVHPKYGNYSKVDIQVPRSVAPHVFPASVVDGQGVGKTIEILYADEMIDVDDAFHFTVRIPQRLDKLPPWLNFTLVLELWFCEKEHVLKKTSKDLFDGFRCLSRRDLHLRLSLDHGLHYHRPILFDYFNLAAVTLTVHASLVQLIPKSSTTSKKTAQACSSPGLTNAGNQQQISNETLQAGTSVGVTDKIRQYHRKICRVLLSAYESLQIRTKVYAQYFPSKYQIRIQSVDTAGKLEALCRRLNEEADPWLAIDQNRQLLSQELSVLWNQFMDLFQLSDQVDKALSAEHHSSRVKRFGEGFFHTEDTLHGLVAASFTTSGQSLGFYSRLVDILKRSTYFCDLPDLPVACSDLDGSPETLPVIFEEKYVPPISSKKASRLPSLNFSESCDNRRKRSGNKLSPENVVKALKNSLCLNLKHKHKPAFESRETSDAKDSDGKTCSAKESDEIVDIDLVDTRVRSNSARKHS